MARFLVRILTTSAGMTSFPSRTTILISDFGRGRSGTLPHFRRHTTRPSSANSWLARSCLGSAAPAVWVEPRAPALPRP